VLHIFAGIHGKEIALDTLKKMFSFNPWLYLPEALFVFEKPHIFRKYELRMDYPCYEGIKSKLHKVPVDPHEYSMSINVSWIGDDIYFINYIYSFMSNPFIRFPYLANDDVLVEDFESYLNSFRKQKK
jgi:hypothetical protein